MPLLLVTVVMLVAFEYYCLTVITLVFAFTCGPKCWIFILALVKTETITLKKPSNLGREISLVLAESVRFKSRGLGRPVFNVVSFDRGALTRIKK